MEYIGSRSSGDGILDVDVDLTSVEVAAFQSRLDGAIRRRLDGLIEMYHPQDHPVNNCMRFVVVANDGEQVFEELQRIVNNAL